MSSNQIPQHKRMAMGKGMASSPKGGTFAKGGSVDKALLKTGMPTSPLTDAKRANGIPGIKAGGKVGKAGC